MSMSADSSAVHRCLQLVPVGQARRISWRAAYTAFFIFVVSFYFMFTLLNDRYIHHDVWYQHPAPCVTPKHIMSAMVEVTFTVSDILTKLQISHTLCFGTLWGALRYGSHLPWDNNIDFCVLRSEMDKVPQAVLGEAFQSHNMSFSYDVRHGEYIITKGPAKAIITIFYESNGDALRDGLENRLLWYFQGNPVSFPSRLLTPEFKTVPFHGLPLPVPNDDLEILKYLYKDDWWLQKPPPGCIPSD